MQYFHNTGFEIAIDDQRQSIHTDRDGGKLTSIRGGGVRSDYSCTGAGDIIAVRHPQRSASCSWTIKTDYPQTIGAGSDG